MAASPNATGFKTQSRTIFRVVPMRVERRIFREKGSNLPSTGLIRHEACFVQDGRLCDLKKHTGENPYARNASGPFRAAGEGAIWTIGK